MELIERSLDRLRCPDCQAEKLAWTGSALQCGGCERLYPVVDGILDFCPEYREGSSFGQRMMENRLFVTIYERYWRPFFTARGTSFDYAAERSWIRERQGVRSARCALDLATGTGRYARILAEAYQPELVLAMDISLPMLRKGRAVAQEKGYTNILFLRANAHRLPARDGAVDLLNCFGALHLFSEVERALAELARVAAPGTVFTCGTACEPGDAEPAWARRWLSREVHFHFFRVDELRAQLDAAGFGRFEHLTDGYGLLFSVEK
jgi:ubiquinone/menaquinone biosynthesis C-methylase UbiE/uncharacterized protein YbaR (Trm112 family)